jgi:hypothetical protein
MMLASYQTAHERNCKLDTKKTLLLAGGISLAAGALWACTPSAVEGDHQEGVLESTKEKTYPCIRLLIQRMVSGNSPAPTGLATSPIPSAMYSRPAQAYTPPTARKVPEFITDDEYADLMDRELQDQLSDPFYEGPPSIFDLRR